jgi:hypothetical protein
MVPYGGHEFLFVRIVREHAISFIVTNVPLSKIFDHRIFFTLCYTIICAIVPTVLLTDSRCLRH